MRRTPSLVIALLLAACGGGSGSSSKPPALDAMVDQTVRELATLTFEVHASGGGTITLAATGLPAGATFEATGAAGTFSWTPADGTVGTYPVTFTATRGSASDEAVVNVVVTRRAPYDATPATAGPASFLQLVPSEDPDGDLFFPTSANVWDISTGFALMDGADDQFDTALALFVGPTGSVDDPGFPWDQVYEELTFSTPVAGDAQGLAAVAVGEGGWAHSGTATAFLSGTNGTTLAQALDLGQATAPITLSFVGGGHSEAEDFYLDMASPSIRVVLRDAAGALLETLIDGEFQGEQTFDLSEYAGTAALILSVEVVGGPFVGAWIDDVSVQSGETEYVQNGDFESGDLTGWVHGAVATSHNVTSGVRAVGDLQVTRSFHTLPGRKWARWVDVFENTAQADVTTNVTYSTDLGSDGAGVIFASEDHTSLAGWDSVGDDRDVGLVFAGTGSAVTPTVSFESTPTLGAYDGNDEVTVVYPITVPAGGRVAIVSFVVMNGVSTGSIAGVTLEAHPADVEAVNAAIVAGWGTDPVYQDGMTPEQRAAVVNF